MILWVRNPWAKWPILTLAAGAVLYCVAWVGTAALLSNQIDAWVGRQREAGTTIAYGDPLIGGFPGRVVISLPGWDVSRPAEEGGWSWRTAAVRVHAAPWRPLAFTVDVAGRHTVGGPWALPGATAWISLTRADITPALLADGSLRSIDIALAEGALAETSGAPPLATLSDARLTVAPQPNETEPAWAISATIAGLRVPDTLELGPFATELRTLNLDARLIGPIAPGPIAESLDAWRRGGGTLDIRTLVLDWPPLGMEGSATLALDERLQPIGAGSIKFKGFFDAVDRMAEDELVKPATASMARIVLGLMARDAPDGSGPELSVAVTLQDGKLNAGPLPLMDVPPVDWGGLR